MSPAPLSAYEALLPTILDGARTARYANLAAWVLLVWDQLICFDEEVEYIWRTKKKLSNVIYVFLRYASLAVVTFNVFSGMNIPKSDTYCVVLMHMSSWPLLALNAVAESVMAARVVVLWDKWVMVLVSTTLLMGVGAVSVLFAERIPMYSKAMDLSIPDIDFYDCMLPPEEATENKIWKMWLILLVYNSILGILACVKGISTYRHKMRRRSHPPLLEIIVRGSLNYYFVIIALNIAMLLLWRYGDIFLFAAGSGITTPITVILSCRLILNLREAYYGGLGEGGSRFKSSLTSSMEARSGRSTTFTYSERIPLRSLTVSTPK